MTKMLYLIAFVCFVTNDAMAQLVSGESPPLMIEGIRQASGVCRRDTQLESRRKTKEESKLPVAKSCVLGFVEIESLLKRNDTILVDFRLVSDFSIFHALNAINLSAGELRQKKQWQNKTLVLLGSGKAENELYEECFRLKQFGFRQVKVVRGGMPMWLAHNMPTVGRQVSSAQLVRLSAAELWQESLNPHNLLLISNSQADMLSDFPAAKLMQHVSLQSIRSVLSHQERSRKGGQVAAVVLVSEQISDEKIGQLQQAIKPTPLLVYAENKKSYERDISLQKAVWSAQDNGPKQLGCGS